MLLRSGSESIPKLLFLFKGLELSADSSGWPLCGVMGKKSRDTVLLREIIWRKRKNFSVTLPLEFISLPWKGWHNGKNEMWRISEEIYLKKEKKRGRLPTHITGLQLGLSLVWDSNRVTPMPHTFTPKGRQPLWSVSRQSSSRCC